MRVMMNLEKATRDGSTLTDVLRNRDAFKVVVEATGKRFDEVDELQRGDYGSLGRRSPAIAPAA